MLALSKRPSEHGCAKLLQGPEGVKLVLGLPGGIVFELACVTEKLDSSGTLWAILEALG